MPGSSIHTYGRDGETEVLVHGPHGLTELVEENGLYQLRGDAPDRLAMIMIAIGVLENITDEEREEFGLEGVYL